MPPVGARKNAKFKAVSTAPSINKTPMGPSTPPVPYPVFQDLSCSINTVNSVTLNGDPAYVLDQTTQPMCTGDAPGVALGIKSNTVSGEVKPVKGSSTVNAGGNPVVRELDPCTLNGGNCPGIYVTQPVPGGSVVAGTPESAPTQLAPETTKEDEGFFAKLWRKSKETLSADAEKPGSAIKGAIKNEGNAAASLGHLVQGGLANDVSRDMADQAALMRMFGMDQQADVLLQESQKAAEHAQDLWSQPDPFPLADKYEQAGANTSDVAQLLFIVKGLAEAGLKRLGKLSQLGKAGEVAKAAELSKGGTLEGQVAKIEQTATKTETLASKGEAVAKAEGDFGKTQRVEPEVPKEPSAQSVSGQSPGDGVSVEGASKRPSWRQSEKDVGKRLEQGFEEQKSFKNGREVPYGTEGSTRPDWYKPGTSIEVKNYNIETVAGQDRLVDNVTKQAIDRAANLPDGTVQKLVIDVRGQQVSRGMLENVLGRISDGSNGLIKPENITILR